MNSTQKAAASTIVALVMTVRLVTGVAGFGLTLVLQR
jgi:hypothetical protein